MRKVKIGFVPLHREPFDENWAIELRKRFIKTLSEVENIMLLYPSENLTKNGLVRNDEDADKVIRLFKAEEVEGLILGTMTFGDEVAGARIADSLRVPVMVFATKEPTISPEGFRKSDSFCGTLSLTSALYRRELPFKFLGIVLPEDELFLKSVNAFARTCAIVGGFKWANIGLIGPRPERFETCTFNEAEMLRRFSQKVVPVDLSQVILLVNSLSDSDPDVVKTVQEINKYVKSSEVPLEKLKIIAKVETVLRRIFRDKRLSAAGVRCWIEFQHIYGIAVCHILGRLTDSGMLCACESDIYGALTMLIQYLASLETTPPHFVDWTIKHPEKDNLVLMWHCGNAPPSLVCPGCPINLRYHSILFRDVGVERSYGTAEFKLKSNTVTINRLTEHKGEFKMLITRGRIVEDPLYTRGSYSWVEVEDLDRLYRVLVEEGFVHHASMIHGDYVTEIEDACKFLGIKPVVV
jgi:L-fucose isomerase-like protein